MKERNKPRKRGNDAKTKYRNSVAHAEKSSFSRQGKKNKFSRLDTSSDSEENGLWYGRRAVEALLNARIDRRINISGVTYCARRGNSTEPDWSTLSRQSGLEYRETSPAELDEMIGHNGHQSLVLQAPFALPGLDADTLFSAENGVFLVLEEVEDPGNLGAIARTALGLGVSGLIMTKHRSTRIGATAMKASAGALAWLPTISVGGIPALLLQLAQKNPAMIKIGLAMDGQPIHELLNTLKSNSPRLIVLGSEGDGISRLTRERCDILVSLPQIGPIESYNVSVSAAMVLFAALAQ